MPRIEIIPAVWTQNQLPTDGAPTADVCRKCAKAFVEGKPLPSDTLVRLHATGQMFDENDMVGSIEVAHPSYSEGEPGQYICDCCEEELTDLDD